MGCSSDHNHEEQEELMKPELKSPVKKEKGQILVILALSLVAILRLPGWQLMATAFTIPSG